MNLNKKNGSRLAQFMFFNEKKIIVKFIFSLFFLVSFSGFSVEVNDVYTVKVATDSSLENGLQKAFELVLIRASGQTDFNNPVIQKAKKSAKKFVVQYGYIEQQGEKFIQVTFNKDSIDNLLKQVGLPLWGSLRPLTLIWLAKESDFHAELINENNQLIQESRILDIVEQRAVPLLFPMLDLDDMLQISAADVWGGFVGNVQEASARYEADQMVLAKLFKVSADNYELQWKIYSLKDNGNVIVPLIDGAITWNNEVELLANWVNKLSDVIAERFAFKSLVNESNMIDFEVYNITDLQSVIEAEKSLRSMTVVNNAILKSLTINGAVFEVQLSDKSEMFYLALQLNKQFKLIEQKQEYTDELLGNEISHDQANDISHSYMWIK